ncbi:MAG: peptidase [Sphingomonas bacterium]|uniref:M16 family metallopeptidase n=1 Tax=Sphingomonas bacterium TaxID=1895847 RepID=UPI0026028204|nr:M16 family metallopeptidase [Sphingomonas bacterium]MDB5707156.1 peptidase [Sphingomonas bacterium]
MHVSSRALRLSLIASLFFGLAPTVSGQNVQPHPDAAAPEQNIASRDAWLYKGSDIVPDAAWRFGTLTNGLRYAVRKNGVPPGQVSVRVRIDAGSLMENDSELGFAHLIEHLSFRGSEYVPDNETKRVWQRLGATFGSDSNAQTTPTQTVYKLDLPNASEASLDESLKILAGMVSKPNITQTALDGERPAVLAEQREQPGPQVRLSDATNALFFAGQPFADRSPIGHIKTLEAATPEAVRAFHDRWYRPERAVVVVSGDLDPALFERLVAKYFGAWRGTGAAPAEPDFGTPDAKQPATAAIVEPGLPPSIQMAVLRPWKFNADTVIFNQNRLVDQVAAAVINRRLETRARAGGSYVLARVIIDDPARSANGTFLQVMPVGDDWEAALKDVRAVVADAQAAPPSQAEIDRELADQAVTYKTMVDTARADAGSKLADDMVQAVDIRETTTSASVIQDVFADARRRKMFTPARILASSRKIFEGVATRAIVSTTKPDDKASTKLAAVLGADVKGLAGARTAQASVNFSKLPKLGPPAKVVSREKVSEFGLEKVVLSNGVRLMVYSTNSEDDRVYVRVRFGGGYNALPADREAPVWAADFALIASGIGKLRQGDIDQMAAGRRIGLDFDVDDDAFQLGALTSPGDLSDQLRLMAAKLAAPAWDPSPLARAKTLVLANYAGLDASPDGVIARDLEGLLRSGDPRWGTPTREEIQQTTPESFRALWEPLLATGPIEVQVFGDISVDEAIKAVARTIGALKPRANDARPAPPIHFPAHNLTPVIRTHDGPENQAAAVIAWPTGGGIEGIEDSRRLDVLAAIFSDRLFDRLRSEAGASYSPNVSSSWPIGLASGGRLMAVGQVAPSNLPLFFRLSREIAADLVSNPVSDDELKRTIGPMTQALIRQSTGNQFWMLQLGGATYDPRRLSAFRSVLSDISTMTAADLQAAARKYLRSDTDWTMEVVPKSAAGTMAAK